MGTSAFDDFVRREHATAEESKREEIDWEAEKERWLRDIDQLFSQVREYLKAYVDAGQIKIAFKTIELNEEHIGAYTAPVMVIQVGSKTINLEPIGTLLIGSRGRVDVIGPAARAQLVLLDSSLTSLSQLIHVSVGIGGRTPVPPPTKSSSKTTWAWRIVTRPPKREIVEVTQEKFLNLLLETANG